MGEKVGDEIKMDNLTRYNDPETAVIEWENKNNNLQRIRPSKTRNLLIDIATVNIVEKRGFTRDDIKFKTKNDDKRGMLYRLKSKRVIIPLKKRVGRLEQYVLANLYDE